jgi:hypothetical protein
VHHAAPRMVRAETTNRLQARSRLCAQQHADCYAHRMLSALRGDPVRTQCPLAELLASTARQNDTRFGRYAERRVSKADTRRALLLIVCGYETRINGDVLEVRANDWVPALLPKAEPMLSYLRKQIALLAPKHPMDPDDERFDAVFASSR